ncbi:hypothetical protein CK203_101296 [Vitis vinifera]|uniref:Uncharacterized protein n=1 Tax=Vitis vinifera TaxID=29760 RepID=A0A438DH00_VITVI|nr:hypothetical protein CK203_101296 [Vitis vinifera]
MARTRGAKSSSPSNRKRSLRKEPSPGSVPEPAPKPSPSRPQPSPVKPAPPKPPARRYLTRSGGQPLKKKARVESSEPIDLTEQSPEKSPNPSPVQIPVPSPVPSPIPSPEATPIPSPVHLRHPKKKLRSLKRQFQSPKLQLKHLWKNIQSEARACPIIPAAEEISYGASASSKGFFLSGHGILGARHIAEALQIPFEPTQFDNFKAWTNPTELEMHWTQRRGVLLEALYKMSEGFFFGPHHLIMAALLYFEEKVHKKKLQRADCIPLLFPRLLCQVLEHLGYPSEPQQERKRICREPFTLDKWNNMTAYKIDQPGQPQPAARRASPRHPPEGITLATPAIPRAPPAAPAPSQPSTSAEPRMAIPISEYRELCRALETLTASQSNLAQELAAIKACQEQMLASQAQQAAILRQLQVHFDLPQAVEPSTETPPEPHSQPSESQASRARSPADPPTEEADPSA